MCMCVFELEKDLEKRIKEVANLSTTHQSNGIKFNKETIVNNPPPAYRESTPLVMRPTMGYQERLSVNTPAQINTAVHVGICI